MENNINNQSSASNNPDVILSLKNITICNNNQIVVDDVSLDLNEGEIHALLGESGSGKSALMEGLCGERKLTSGSIIINKLKNEEVKINNIKDATKNKIGFIHQNYNLVENLSALENIILGNEKTTVGIFVSTKEARKYLAHLMDTYGLKVDLDMKISKMNGSLRKRVEILKVLFTNCDIIIFDEPTQNLSERESAVLLQTMITLKNEGKSIFLLTKNFKMAKRFATRITVLRKGKIEGSFLSQYVDESVLANTMYGRQAIFNTLKNEVSLGEIVLDINNLSIKGKKDEMLLDNINLKIRQREIVAIVSSAYNKQELLVDAILGKVKISNGSINVLGKDITKLKPSKRKMINYAPNNLDDALIYDISTSENLVLDDLKDKDYFSFNIKKKNVYSHFKEVSNKYHINFNNGANSNIEYEDNINKHKVVLSKKLDKEGLLILVEPTTNLDSYSKEEIRKKIIQARDNNSSVLLITCDLDEAYDLASTIYTMNKGRITGKFAPKSVSKKEIGNYQEGLQIQPEFMSKGNF